jgi:hypothetical protein
MPSIFFCAFSTARLIILCSIASPFSMPSRCIVLGGKLEEEATDQEKADWQVQHNKVIKVGGLHIVGTERNESRRVDNQLRGRSGRQGDVASPFSMPSRCIIAAIFSLAKIRIKLSSNDK